MATAEQCPHQSECNFFKWREEKVNLDAQPLPENGDCGIIFERCMRIDMNVHEITLDAVGPATHQEMIVSFPKRPNENGRPERRVTGGAHL